MARRPKLLFVGDVNVDLTLSGLEGPLALDREVFCEGCRATLGGSTALAAAAFARLGGEADICGLVGEDEYGELARRELAAAGVGTGLLRAAGGERTGLTVNLVRASTRTQATFRGSLASFDGAAAFSARLRDYAHLHISGVYGTPRFVPRVAELLRAAREAGATASLDTQWDPSEDWGPIAEWLPLLDVLFANEDEARSIARRLGSGARDAEEASAFLAGRTALPFVKLGPRGALVGGRRVAPFPIEVLDPTGAGDACAAAFLLASKVEGLAVEDAARFACAAGAIACTYAGGLSGELDAGRVRALAL
jgi:sugar/nucleoside kinase (ribokinase family)